MFYWYVSINVPILFFILTITKVSRNRKKMGDTSAPWGMAINSSLTSTSPYNSARNSNLEKNSFHEWDQNNYYTYMHACRWGPHRRFIRVTDKSRFSLRSPDGPERIWIRRDIWYFCVFVMVWSSIVLWTQTSV